MVPPSITYPTREFPPSGIRAPPLREKNTIKRLRSATKTLLTQIHGCTVADAFGIASLFEIAMLEKGQTTSAGSVRRDALTTRPTGKVRPARPLRVDALSLPLLFADETVVLLRPLIVS